MIPACIFDCRYHVMIMTSCLPKCTCQVPFLTRCFPGTLVYKLVFASCLAIYTAPIAACTQEHQPACSYTQTPSLFVHRNINHEKLDAFMCNECGHSRFGKFELSMSCSPCVSYPPLQTQDDMLRALACLEHNVSTAHARHTSLATSVK